MRFKTFLKEAPTHYGSLVNQDKYDRMDRHDKALYKYTADGQTYLGGETIDKLSTRYPFDGGTLYRGFHFDDQEEHDAFLAKIANGELESKHFSSWTTHEATAEDFAHSKKTYFPTMSIVMAHEKMKEEGEHMSGYGGVVISTEVEKNVGIDVRKTSYAKEDEVILPEGTYQVKIEKLVEPFKRKFNNIEQVRVYLKELKKAKEKDDDHDKMMEFLLKSWLNKLDVADVDIMMKYSLMKFLKMDKEFLRDKYSDFTIENTSWRQGDHLLRLSVHVPVNQLLFVKCSETLQKQIITQIKEIAKGAKDKIEQVMQDPNVEKLDEFDIYGLNELAYFLPSEAKQITMPLRRMLGDKYHQLNSREVNKSLTDIWDVRKHGEKIANIVKAMTKL